MHRTQRAHERRGGGARARNEPVTAPMLPAPTPIHGIHMSTWLETAWNCATEKTKSCEMMAKSTMANTESTTVLTVTLKKMDPGPLGALHTSYGGRLSWKRGMLACEKTPATSANANTLMKDSSQPDSVNQLKKKTYAGDVGVGSGTPRNRNPIMGPAMRATACTFWYAPSDPNRFLNEVCRVM